jgi:prepilin-type N-terminal cleavage/methylation domain-containing protein
VWQQVRGRSADRYPDAVQESDGPDRQRENRKEPTMNMRRHRDGEGGFTLIEVLVTLTLIAAIVAIIAPTLFSQLDQGDATQLRGDMQNIANGVKTFRVDVSPVFPGQVEHLANEISTSESSLGSGSYNNGQVNRWNGPYIEVETTVSNDTDTVFTSGFGGEIINGFLNEPNSTSTPGGASGWIVLQVAGLSSSALTTMEEEFDSNATSSSSGRIRSRNDTLFYLAVQK